MTTADTARVALKRQYHAALEMLREGITRCPDGHWLDRGQANAPWQVAYHALFYVHMYLQPNLEAFQPWHGHQSAQYANGFPGPPRKGSELPLLPEPYSKAQVLEFWQVCDGMVDAALDGFDLDEPRSGFPWYSCSKLEHQIISIRHLQHHAAQLGDRLRELAGKGLEWRGH